MRRCGGSKAPDPIDVPIWFMVALVIAIGSIIFLSIFLGIGDMPVEKHCPNCETIQAAGGE